MATDTEHVDAETELYGPATAVPWSRQVKAFALRTLRELFRNRSSLFWSLVAPVFFSWTDLFNFYVHIAPSDRAVAENPVATSAASGHS
jgi:hypothetical protein